jgi:hypothetical protein
LALRLHGLPSLSTLTRRLRCDFPHNVRERDSPRFLCLAAGIVDHLPDALVSAQRESFSVEAFAEGDQRGLWLTLAQEQYRTVIESANQIRQLFLGLEHRHGFHNSNTSPSTTSFSRVFFVLVQPELEDPPV